MIKKLAPGCWKTYTKGAGAIYGGTAMVRNLFDEQLQTLKRSVISLGLLCENSLELIAAFLNGNSQVEIPEIRLLYQKIENKGNEIENNCFNLLIRQQPVASDLRQISASLKIVHDCKRIGDQLVDIADLFQQLAVTPDGHPSMASLRQMARASKNLVGDCMEAYADNDLDLARSANIKDDEVDELFATVKKELALELSKAQPSLADGLLNLLMVAKYFEKISDHAVHIAKWVMYAITGQKGTSA
jgi:phosphate transport system protein